jgi:putative MFS transporter
MDSPDPDRDRYMRLLLWLLLPAAFFNGFDGELRALLLSDIQNTFRVSVATLGLVSVPISAGQFVAFFGVRIADRVGRRPLLLVSLAGYTVFTALTAGAWSIWSFVLFQFFAQVFLGTEYSAAVLVISEEVDPAARGRVLGKLLVAGPLGAVVTAALLGVKLDHTVLGWRLFYLVSLLPLVLIVIARRLLHETRAYRRSSDRRGRPATPTSWRDWFTVWQRPWRARVLTLGMVSFLQKVPVTAGSGWWVYYAERQRHYSTTLVSIYLVTAFGLGTVGYYVCGRAIDRFGRKPTLVLYLSLAAVFGALLFQTSDRVASFFLLLGSVFFGLGVGPALSAYGAELFPTVIRAQGSAWVVNGFASTGAVLGPALVGVLGDRSGLIGNVGDTVSVLAVLVAASAVVAARFLPETRGVVLDEGDDPLSGRLPAQARSSAHPSPP